MLGKKRFKLFHTDSFHANGLPKEVKPIEPCFRADSLEDAVAIAVNCYPHLKNLRVWKVNSTVHFIKEQGSSTVFWTVKAV